jgi:hypothetical protein
MAPIRTAAVPERQLELTPGMPPDAIPCKAQPLLAEQPDREESRVKNAAEDDTEGLERLRRGDPSALEPLYARYSRMAFARCLGVLGDERAAQAALEATYLEVWLTADAYDAGRETVERWITAIALRKALKKLQGRLRCKADLGSDVGLGSR